jgi:hypothetical protein
MDITINYLAVFIAALVSFIIGWLWYSPMVFGKLWVKEAKIDPAAMEAGKKQMPVSAGIGFLSQLVASYVIAHLLALLLIIDIAEALQFAFWGWLGLSAVPMLGMVLWERKSVTYYAITAGYWLVGFCVIAAILTWWI